MRTKASKLVRELWFLKWVAKAVWCNVTGRWFCFRNTPDVVVRLIAIAASSGEKTGDDSLDALILSAQAEWKLRCAIRKRKGAK